MTALTISIIAVNIVAFLVFMIDKLMAKMSKIRIPEWVLLLLGLCYGATGGYVAMQVFQHKTKNLLFAVLMPVMMVVQMGYLIWR
jgi:uncharacterized membrane protein YsdA (DUF1294 family)